MCLQSVGLSCVSTCWPQHSRCTEGEDLPHAPGKWQACCAWADHISFRQQASSRRVMSPPYASMGNSAVWAHGADAVRHTRAQTMTRQQSTPGVRPRIRTRTASSRAPHPHAHRYGTAYCRSHDERSHPQVPPTRGIRLEFGKGKKDDVLERKWEVRKVAQKPSTSRQCMCICAHIWYRTLYCRSHDKRSHPQEPPTRGIRLEFGKGKEDEMGGASEHNPATCNAVIPASPSIEIHTTAAPFLFGPV